MPLYKCKCFKCGKIEEYLLAICEDDVEVDCPKCGAKLTRKNNRYFSAEDAPAIHGETVVGKTKW